jgi:hypothetical protein
VSVATLAARIDAAPDRLAYLLGEELARGRVRQDGDRWTLVAEASPPGTVEARPLVAEDAHGSSLPLGRTALSGSLPTSISPPRFPAAATTASSARYNLPAAFAAADGCL